MKTRVLFVNVVDPSKPIQVASYPLSFAYLKSYAEKFGETVKSRYVEIEDFAELHTVVGSFRPQVVALTAITENWDRARNIAAWLRSCLPKVKIIVGGPHISAVPSSLTIQMDVGVIGEGEQTFLELLMNGAKPSDRINGIVFYRDGKLIQTTKRDLIEPLDTIPYPDRGIFPRQIPSRPVYIFTSRGCPYRCIFCSSSRFWGKVRFHSPLYVAGEIESLKRKGYNQITIYDDCFVLDMDRVAKIADLVKNSGIEFAVGGARANLVTDEVATILKSMNVTSVGMGLESNSQKVLDWLQKGNTVEDNQRAVNILRRHGLRVHCSFIRDIPIETKADLSATYGFIRRNNLSFDMYSLMGFPNTPLWDKTDNWRGCAVRYYGRSYPRRALNWAKRKALSIIRGSS